MIDNIDRWGLSITMKIMLLLALLTGLLGPVMKDTAHAFAKDKEHSKYSSMKTVSQSDMTIHFIPTEPSYPLGKAEPKEGAYLGAYVLQDEAISGSMQSFNELIGKQHATFFKYVGYGQPFPTQWVEQVKAAGAFPHIAWEPNKGLEQVLNDAYIREFAAQARQADIPIFLRFASEMNGTWTNYSGNPTSYKETWRMVHDIFEKEAPKVAMVWTVLAFPVRTMERFYPGDRYVDWVGVNVYHVKYHNGDEQYRASHEDPHDMLNYVYNRFSRTKPIQLSEFGVTHFNTTDGKKDNRFAINRMSRLYRHLKNDYPRVKAVYYFDVNNVTAYNKARQVNDYSLTSELELLEAYRRVTASDYFLSRLDQAPEASNQRVEQRFTFRGGLFEENGVIYVDEQFFRLCLQLNVSINERTDGSFLANLQRQDGAAAAQAPVKGIQRKIWTGTKKRNGSPIYREINALPLRQAAKGLGYEVNLHGNNIYIHE
jgi:hypothetical protein